MTVRVGQAACYTNSEGNQRPATIFATEDSWNENEVFPKPQPGHVHATMVSLHEGLHVRLDLPLRETIEGINDFWVEGKLVGFIETV